MFIIKLKTNFKTLYMTFDVVMKNPAIRRDILENRKILQLKNN